MPVSQFTYYSSSQLSAPVLSGSVGSLLTVLDAILVNGYGSKAAAGWTKPIANSGNIGCYKQGNGALNTLFVNDNGPGTGTFQDAWVTGWETLATIGAPVGTGGGQYPLPAQQLTTGKGVFRKSNALSSAARDWSCFADAYTFYFFSNSGATTPAASTGLWFGDMYSLKGSSDVGRSMLITGATDNVAQSPWEQAVFTSPTATLAGHFAARTWGGGGGSVAIGKFGDAQWGINSSTPSSLLQGVIPCPNGPDNSIYIAPLRVNEANGNTRGRIRGVYMLAHASSLFTEGQTFGGVGDYSGKTFQMTPGGAASGTKLAIEITNTVETN